MRPRSTTDSTASSPGAIVTLLGPALVVAAAVFLVFASMADARSRVRPRAHETMRVRLACHRAHSHARRCVKVAGASREHGSHGKRSHVNGSSSKGSGNAGSTVAGPRSTASDGSTAAAVQNDPQASGGKTTNPVNSDASTAPSAEAGSSSGIEPVAPGPSSAPGTGTGWDGFGGGSLPGAGWRPYASNSPFNLTVEGDEVHPNSAAIVKKVLGWSLPGNLGAGEAETAEDWGHPTYFAEPTDPVYTLHATEPWGNNPLNGLRIPIPEKARPAGGEDGHMTVVTPDGWEYDFWRAQAPPAGGGTFTFAWGGRTRIDGSGLDSGGTASGFGNLAGMIRAPELAAGKINHALFLTVRCTAGDTSFGYETVASTHTSSYVYPATAGGSTCPAGEANAPPMGARFSLAMSDAQIQALSVPAWKKTILTALAHYGGYVGDTGGPGFGFMFESSSSYTALGLPDPLVAFAKANNLPTWEGKYVFNMANGVEWEKYLRVLVPPGH